MDIIRRIFWALILLLLSVSTALAVVIERSSTPVLPFDPPALTGSHAAFRVTNIAGGNGGLLAEDVDVWLALENLSSGALQLKPELAGEGYMHLGSIAEFETAVAFVPLAWPHLLDPDEESFSADVVLYDRRPDRPGAAVLSQQSFGWTVERALASAANQVHSLTVSNGFPAVGNLIEVTVEGETGAMTAGGKAIFSPASLLGPTGPAYELVSSTITFFEPGTEQLSGSLGPNPLVNQLLALSLDGEPVSYLANYVFRVIEDVPALTPLDPTHVVESGGALRYPGAMELPPFPVTGNLTALIKEAVPATVNEISDPSLQTTYTLRFENQSEDSVLVDELLDQLPPGVLPVSGSFELDGAPIPDPESVGSMLLWNRFFTVPPAIGIIPGSSQVTFQAELSDRQVATVHVEHSLPNTDYTINLITSTAAGGINVTHSSGPGGSDIAIGLAAAVNVEPMVNSNVTAAADGDVIRLTAISPSAGFLPTVQGPNLSLDLGDYRNMGTATIGKTVISQSLANALVIVQLCGDYQNHLGEACDDGNDAAGDGCTSNCTIQPGWSCGGQPSQCVETFIFKNGFEPPD